MMAEGIQKPSDLYLHAESVATIPFCIKHLANKGFAARHVVVGHDIEAANDLQTPFGHKFSKIIGFFGVALEERLEIGDLVQDEPIIGMFLEQSQCRQN